jgi:hypothetical protein
LNKEYYREEWEKLDFFEEKEDCDGNCICGKTNIRYQYKITNVKNGEEIYPVGSECIKKIDNENLDSSLKRIEKDLKNKEARKKLIGKYDNEIMTVGKYKDKTYKYIVENDIRYSNFIYDNAFSKEYKKFKKYLELLGEFLIGI